MAERAPRPEAELGLLLAGTRSRREAASARIAQLADRVDEAALVEFLADQRLLLLAGTRLAELAPHALSANFLTRLDAARASARAVALLFRAVGRHLADALERTGIPTLELKGAALAADLHGDPTLRTYADIDLLVAADALDRAVAVVQGLGWNASPKARGDKLPQLHRWLSHPDGTLPVVELHWRIHWYESRFAGAALARSRFVDGERRLDPTDQLAALLLFYARDGFTGLRLAADIGAWWDRHGNGATIRGLERVIDEHPALSEPLRTALAAAGPVAGLPASSTTIRPRSRRAALAWRLRNWDQRGDVDQIRANVTLVDGLLAPREDLGAFARRHVLAPSPFLTEVYGVSPDARVPMAGWRAWHAMKTAGRYGAAFWGLRRGRWWSPLP
jgi:Uncharacterised nucleotidyltransferase